MSIAILTPSRGRPQRFRAMLDAIHRTASDPENIVVYAALDNDDTTRHAYPQTDDVIYVHGGRLRLAAWTNRLAALAISDGHDIIGFLGDDHRPRTPGWDRAIARNMDDIGGGLVYCDDGLQHERLPTAPFWDVRVIRALGWFYPPVLMHLFADDYWLRLANDLRRSRYLSDVLIEHEHPSIAKAAWDESYRESERFYDRDREAFEAFIRDGHGLALVRAREALCGR